jgi:hypothetical protein
MGPRGISLLVVAIVAALPKQARASYAPPMVTPSTEGRQGAIDAATTPVPIKTQIAFKPSYTFPNGANRYTAELLFEPVLP